MPGSPIRIFNNSTDSPTDIIISMKQTLRIYKLQTRSLKRNTQMVHKYRAELRVAKYNSSTRCYSTVLISLQF